MKWDFALARVRPQLVAAGWTAGERLAAADAIIEHGTHEIAACDYDAARDCIALTCWCGRLGPGGERLTIQRSRGASL